jgi:hypothetical protein
VKTEKLPKLHEPVLDHNGKPYSPAQILALERAELTRIRVLRDSMDLAMRREELVETDVVTRQAAALFVATRQKLLAIPHTLSHRLVGKDHGAIHDALTGEIHEALRELADFSQKVVNPDWSPEDDGNGARPPLIDPDHSPKGRVPARVRKRQATR